MAFLSEIDWLLGTYLTDYHRTYYFWPYFLINNFYQCTLKLKFFYCNVQHISEIHLVLTLSSAILCKKYYPYLPDLNLTWAFDSLTKRNGTFDFTSTMFSPKGIPMIGSTIHFWLGEYNIIWENITLFVCKQSKIWNKN